ncbi:MAG: murein L,D-transpeptidase [Anaerolineales bacterium]|nr:MAG: murein L,D-transpeptidase [Anaerolineales bacterium]
MRLRWICLMIVLFVLLPGVAPAEAAPVSVPGDVKDSLGPLCPLRLQLRQPTRCNQQGERSGLAMAAARGIYPQHPLPLTQIDPSLGSSPFNYIQSRRDGGTPLYTSLNDALRDQNPYRIVDPGFVYFSWIERYDQDNSVAYMIVPGVYVNGTGMSRLSPPSFRGVAFTHTPSQTFAWVLAHTETRRGPGSDQPLTGRTVERFQIVQIFDTKQIDDWVWYQIGPEDWVEQRHVAKVVPDATRPEGVESDRWISIDLFEQTMVVYEDGQMIFATLLSSGLEGWWTQPGVFQVYKKLVNDPMSGAFAADRSDYYYLEDVPWILYFDQARAIHGAYWHNGYGYPRSHGCVNLSPADANWIFNWAEEGTWVYVYDPSGRTPTDPATYGAGGA